MGGTSLQLSDIDDAAAALASQRREEIQRQIFALPEWFDTTLDPESGEYRNQQLRLWREISGLSDYSLANEAVPEIRDADGLLRPGFYQAGDSTHAGEHLIALGHVVYRSEVKSGDTALEYGAGFGQIALALARLGVHVDTVDLNPDFCSRVNQLSERYAVDLQAHNEVFGWAPDGKRYDLVYFYESFHHCLEFRDLIPRLLDLLKPDGRVILAGEPIVDDDSPIVPCKWGLRMDAENVVVVRQRGWMELGFQESYLFGMFVRAGFVWERHPCPPSRQAQLWVLRARPQIIELANHSLTPLESAGWHAPEPSGRWTTDRSLLFVDARARDVELTMLNCHPFPQQVSVTGADRVEVTIPPRQRTSVRISQLDGQLTIECNPVSPLNYGENDDPRSLGIFVETLSY